MRPRRIAANIAKLPELKRPPNGRLLLVRTKHVANIGSYGENAQRFVCSQSFTYPRDALPQDVPLWLSKCFVPEY
jgi:hypothetical protein